MAAVGYTVRRSRGEPPAASRCCGAFPMRSRDWRLPRRYGILLLRGARSAWHGVCSGSWRLQSSIPGKLPASEMTGYEKEPRSMSACIDFIVRPRGSLSWLDGLSRAAAVWVMIVVVVSVASVSLSPPIRRATISESTAPAVSAAQAVEKSWDWTGRGPDFDGMYRSSPR